MDYFRTLTSAGRISFQYREIPKHHTAKGRSATIAKQS